MQIDDELWANVNETLRTVDTALFGRVAYQGFAEYWPAAAKNPASPQHEIDFARWIERTPKVVFSKTLQEADWKNSRLAKGDLTAEVTALRREPGKDILLFGGGKIAAAFMTAGLIDDYRITVYPIVLGEGKPLFTEVNNRMKLKLLGTRTFKSRPVALRYQEDEG